MDKPKEVKRLVVPDAISRRYQKELRKPGVRRHVARALKALEESTLPLNQ